MAGEPLTFQTYTSLEELQGTWETLQDRVPHHPFQRYRWISAWVSTIGTHGGHHRFIVARDASGATQAILPICLVSMKGLRRLTWIGGSEGDYLGPLAAPEFWDALGSRDIRPIIRQLIPTADVIQFHRAINDRAGQSNPLIPSRFSWESKTGYLMHLPSEPGPLPLRAKFAADTARRRRFLLKMGPPRLDIPETRAEREQITRFMILHKQKKHQATGHDDVFQRPEYAEFYLRLCEDPAIHVSALSFGDRMVAAHWGARLGSRLYWIMPAFDREYARYAPGRLHLHAVIEWCIEHGVRLFDFTIGDEVFKLTYANERIPLYSSNIPLTLKGGLYCRFSAARRSWSRRRPAPGLAPADEADEQGDENAGSGKTEQVALLPKRIAKTVKDDLEE